MQRCPCLEPVRGIRGQGSYSHDLNGNGVPSLRLRAYRVAAVMLSPRARAELNRYPNQPVPPVAPCVGSIIDGISGPGDLPTTATSLDGRPCVVTLTREIVLPAFQQEVTTFLHPIQA